MSRIEASRAVSSSWSCFSKTSRRMKHGGAETTTRDCFSSFGQDRKSWFLVCASFKSVFSPTFYSTFALLSHHILLKEKNSIRVRLPSFYISVWSVNNVLVSATFEVFTWSCGWGLDGTQLHLQQVCLSVSHPEEEQRRGGTFAASQQRPILCHAAIPNAITA